MINRLLIVICQKVGSTGSGVVVRELVREAARRVERVMVVCGASVDDDPQDWFAPDPIEVRAVRFGGSEPDSLPFDVVGMSNQMPYPSSTFASLNGERLDEYVRVWSEQIGGAISEFQPDVVHVHHLWLLVHIIDRVSPVIPRIVSLHGTDLQRAVDAPHIRSLVGRSLSQVRWFIALTQNSVKDACETYDLTADRFAVLGNGFNSHIFRRSTAIQQPIIRDLVPALKGRPLVLFVGKYSEWKGITHLIHALSKLRKRTDLNPVCWIIGSGPDDVREGYLKLITDEALDPDICLLGQLSQVEVATAMNLAHVLVMPSFNEPFGLVWLEAMACGSRMIAANQGGPAEFVPYAAQQRGYVSLITGLTSLSPTNQEEEQYISDLTDAIEWQLRQPLSEEMRREISATVQHLTWTHYVDRLFTLYESCL